MYVDQALYINTVKDHSIHARKNIQTGFPWSMAFRVRFITNSDDFSQFMGVLNYCPAFAGMEGQQEWYM